MFISRLVEYPLLFLVNPRLLVVILSLNSESSFPEEYLQCIAKLFAFCFPVGNQEGGMGKEKKGLNQDKDMMDIARETHCVCSVCLKNIRDHQKDLIKTIIYH